MSEANNVELAYRGSEKTHLFSRAQKYNAAKLHTLCGKGLPAKQCIVPRGQPICQKCVAVENKQDRRKKWPTELA